MKIKELLEGGWADTSTQNTIITPELVRKTLIVVEHFIFDFNNFLRNKNIPGVIGIEPAGSTHYYERDLKNKTGKVYGDIDVEFYLPRLENMNENSIGKLYSDEIIKYCQGKSNIKTTNGTAVIFKVGKEFIQVDLIKVLDENRHWIRAVVPEYGIKGAVSSAVYGSLAELLNLSIGSNGIQAKIKNGKLVPFRTVSVDQIDVISKDPEHWAIDIFRYFNKNNKVTNILKQYPGIIPGNLKISDIVNAIKALGQSLNYPIFGINSYEDFINKIMEIYNKKLDKTINGTKFDKAETPGAIEKAKSDKNKLLKGKELVLNLFREA